jgi:hypothetical protein
MITCSVCRNRELEGELFCSECGARLAQSWPNPASTAAFADTSRIRESVRIPAATPSRLRSGQIALSINGIAQPVLLEGRPEYVLGREGHEQVVPDLNLNPYGARDKGVSRVHAALRRDHARLLLIDLGSTNGTRLNGKPLPAHQPTQVENGDEIRLGKLVMTINFAP